MVGNAGGMKEAGRLNEQLAGVLSVGGRFVGMQLQGVARKVDGGARGLKIGERRMCTSCLGMMEW
jgi:hypothetical protein